MLQKKKKNPKNIALWVSCKLQITDLSYYERFHSPGVSKCSGRVTHLRGQILEILWKGQAHKCYNRKFVSKAHPLPAASPTAHTTTGTLQMSHSPTISSTIWEITTVPKVLKKKKKESRKVMAFAVWPRRSLFPCTSWFELVSLPFHWQWSCNCAGLRLRPCYRVEKGSGGLSGGWWDAATFIPGTRTVSVEGYLQSLDPVVQHWRIGLRGRCWVSSRSVRWGRLHRLLLMWLEAWCLAWAEAQAWPSVVAVAAATLGWGGMGCAPCLDCFHWDWGTPPVQLADQHQGRQVGQTPSASPEGGNGWLGVRNKAQAAGW